MRRQDQDQINEFGRLNTRKTEIADELETARVSAECGDGGGAPPLCRWAWRSVPRRSTHVERCAVGVAPPPAQKLKEELEDAEEHVMLASDEPGTVK